MNLATILVLLGLASFANAQTANINIPYTPESAPLIIHAMAAKYGANGNDLVTTANCESGFANLPRHWDVTGYAYGNFQFHRSTFYNNAAMMGIINPDITNPIQQTAVAAWMFSTGQSRQWTCAPKTGLSSP